MSARAHAPVPGSPPEPRFPDVATRTLSCGLQCHIVQHPGLPVVDARLIVRGGAARDEPARAGRSWLLAELLDQGTRSRSATQIADEAELLGASLETRATWDAVTIALHVLTPRFEAAFALLHDVAVNATFPAEELERKRSERLAAILQERDEPRVLSAQVLQRCVYDPSHPFSVPLAGTAESIAALTRSNVTDLYTKSFTPERAFLVLVGDLEPDRFVEIAERHFAAWSVGTDPVPAIPDRVRDGPRAVHIVNRPGAPQSELRVGLPGPPRATPDYFTLLVANTVLGGAFTSRLNLRLREEKAYTYGAGSSFALRVTGGPFVASTAVATAATADAIDVIVHEVTRMGTEPVPAAELERARQYLVLGLARTFETTSDIADHVGELALHGLGFDWYDRYPEAVRAVSADDVLRACTRVLDPLRLTIAVVGDAVAIREEIEALNIGAVHVHEID